MIWKYVIHQKQKEKRTEQNKLFDNWNHGKISLAPSGGKADLPLPGVPQAWTFRLWFLSIQYKPSITFACQENIKMWL